MTKGLMMLSFVTIALALHITKSSKDLPSASEVLALSVKNVFIQ